MLDFAAACYIPYDGPRYVQVGVHAAINIQIQFFEQSSKRWLKLNDGLDHHPKKMSELDSHLPLKRYGSLLLQYV